MKQLSASIPFDEHLVTSCIGYNEEELHRLREKQNYKIYGIPFDAEDVIEAGYNEIVYSQQFSNIGPLFKLINIIKDGLVVTCSIGEIDESTSIFDELKTLVKPTTIVDERILTGVHSMDVYLLPNNEMIKIDYEFYFALSVEPVPIGFIPLRDWVERKARQGTAQNAELNKYRAWTVLEREKQAESLVNNISGIVFEIQKINRYGRFIPDNERKICTSKAAQALKLFDEYLDITRTVGDISDRLADKTVIIHGKSVSHCDWKHEMIESVLPQLKSWLR